MNADGLFALSIEDAQRILKWPMVEWPDTTWWDEDDEALWKRIRRWKRRHSEATP